MSVHRRNDFWVVLSEELVRISANPALGHIHSDCSRLTHDMLSALHVNRLALNDFYEPLLAQFHTEDYLAALRAEQPDPRFFSGDDQPFEGVWQYAKTLVDGTCTAVDMLSDAVDLGYPAPVTMFWQGGRHHAQAERASGFCWLNDCVIGIHRMKERFQRILYIDLDFHHADGVQAAFEKDPDVFVVSVHAYDGKTIFPYSGPPTDTGTGAGEGRTLNVAIPPSMASLTDSEFASLVSRAVDAGINRPSQPFVADAVMLVVGADTISHDPLTRGFSVSSRGLCEATLGIIRDTTLPTVVLGGGGYWPTNVAKVAGAVSETISTREVPGDDVPLPPGDPNVGEYRPVITLHTQKLQTGQGTGKTRKVDEVLNSVFGSRIQAGDGER